jgi:hypothetical protein
MERQQWRVRWWNVRDAVEGGANERKGKERMEGKIGEKSGEKRESHTPTHHFPVDRRHERHALVDATRTGLERARKELLQRHVRVERVAALGEVGAENQRPVFGGWGGGVWVWVWVWVWFATFGKWVMVVEV